MDPRELEGRLEALEARVRALEARLAREPPPLPPAWTSAAPAPVPAPPAVPGRGRPVRADVEKLLGANWLARAGVLVLALGVVFFLKLAIDSGWIGLVGRVVLGVVGGLLLLGLGDVLRARRFDPHFAQVLAGGGAVISYVSLYLGYASPPLREAIGWNLPAALAALALASALLGAYALWRDLPLLAGLAVVLSAFLLAPAGDFSTAGLFYSAFLSAALLCAAAWRGWGQVSLVALLAADLVLFVGLQEGEDWRLVAGLALVVNGLAATAADAVARGRREAAQASAFLAPLLLFFLLAACLEEGDVADGPAWSALATGTATALAAAFARRRTMSFGLAAGALLLLWPGLHFHHLGASYAWALLAGVAIALGAALVRARNALHAGAALAGLLGLADFYVRAATEGVVQEEKLASFGAAALLVASGLALWLVRRSPPLGPPLVQHAGLGTAFGAPVVLLGFLLEGWAIAVSWALLALGVVAAGMVLRDRDLRVAAFALFGFVLARIFLVDFSALDLPARVATFVLTGVLLLVAAFLYARGRPPRPDVPDATKGTPK